MRGNVQEGGGALAFGGVQVFERRAGSDTSWTVEIVQQLNHHGARASAREKARPSLTLGLRSSRHVRPMRTIGLTRLYSSSSSSTLRLTRSRGASVSVLNFRTS